MGVKPIFLDKKLHMGVLLVTIIEKYKEIDKNLRFLQHSEENWLFLSCYHMAYSTTKCAHFLAVESFLDIFYCLDMSKKSLLKSKNLMYYL